MDLGLKGKVALVTGSGEGIGRRTILTFAQEGADVVVNDLVPTKVEKVVEEAKAFGVRVLGKTADVTHQGQVNEMVKEIISEMGKIDILVNNAYASDRKFFTQSSKADWDKPINVCLYGTLNVSRAVVDPMMARKYGKIVNLVSDAARIGEPNLPIYAAAKAGILAFSRSLAKEVGKYNMNVNCVSPGATWTERRVREHQAAWDKATAEERERLKKREEKQLKLYPTGRLGEPEDVANMIVFLATERARQITGEVISVNGGYAMV
jgi:NAD(P)-dependent dehydrogenase (short-subunit alcohol dehydrogenase family)